MCDGYYWPISFSTSRRGFHRDANVCKASCGSEAQLFFHHKTSGEPASMTDLAGRSYSRLPNAFRYRKALVPGCRCKPEPWSEAEVERHRRYAAAASLGPAGTGPLTAQAGDAGAATTPETAKPGAEAATAPATGEATSAAAPTQTNAPAPTSSASRAAHASTGPTKWRRPTAVAARPAAAGAPQPASARRAPRLAPAQMGLGGNKLRWPGD
jgi:hypothetical protein